MFEGFNRVTDKQVEALMLIAPGPIGKGLTYKKAAEKLGIAESSFIGRIKNFKTNFPEPWKNFQTMQKVASKQRKSLAKPLSLDSLGYNMIVLEDLR